MDLFLRHEDVLANEKELLKGLTVPEMVSAMMGNCQVAAPGVTKLAKEMKTRKKTNNKG